VSNEESRSNRADKSAGQPFRVRLPGFVSPEEDVGLGDVIKRATSLAGVKPCSGCSQRAAALNRRVAFSGRRSR